MNWEQAEEYLDILIKAFAKIGCQGCVALNGTLRSLKRRYDSGERSKELYEKMVKLWE